jgi:hypothetical protein
MTAKELRDAALITEHGRALDDFLGDQYREGCTKAAAMLLAMPKAGVTSDVVSPVAVALLGHAIATKMLELTERGAELCKAQSFS